MTKSVAVRWCRAVTRASVRTLLRICFWGWFGVTTAGCGIDGTMPLRTTEYIDEMRPSPFCRFQWSATFEGTPAERAAQGKVSYPTNLGMFSLWMGYEKDDRLDNSIKKMLAELRGNGELRGKIPVLYAYMIPFKAYNQGLNKDCAPNSTSPNICTEGAAWIRANRDYLRDTYDSYARQLAAIWGTERPLLWLFEPGFNDYTRTSQSEPFTLPELGALAEDLVGTLKGPLPNALVSVFASPEIADYDAYFGAFDLQLIDFVHVTGAAIRDYFGSPTSIENPQATYAAVHRAAERPLFVDTGFSASDVKDNGWLTSDYTVINRRIADGVVAVQLGEVTAEMESQIDAVSTKTVGLMPEPQMNCIK
ncbi:MAG: hypothetical protein QM784_26435 [Polyangiaceae bacterium]